MPSTSGTTEGSWLNVTDPGRSTRGTLSTQETMVPYGEINEFERELPEHRTIVAKFWMSVSQAEQLARFRERDRNPLKRFKVDPEDWHNRKQWRSYQQAAREIIALTDTKHAPWVIVPSDDKRRARLAVLRALCERIESVIG